MGYTILQPIDTKRYTPMEGMEGPYMQRSGKVLYYDPVEGKYYCLLYTSDAADE